MSTHHGGPITQKPINEYADNLLRCDYRVTKAEDTEILYILKDYLHPLPEKIQRLVLDLRQRYIDMGMTCVTLYDDAVHFAYSNIKNSRKTLSSRDTLPLDNSILDMSRHIETWLDHEMSY